MCGTMTRYLSAALALVALLWSAMAHGQSRDTWIQVEAKSGASEAGAAAARYADRLDRVEGYRLGSSNWYAVVLGPFGRAEAENTRRQLRASRAIPGDSFLTDGASFRGRFWPEAGATGSRGALPEPVETAPLGEIALVAPETRAAPQASPPEPDETRAEALRSERLLDGEQRRTLQIALKWAGFYDSGIDGAFGRGTRAAMEAWQGARGYDGTGVLTTLQRTALIREYNSVLDGLDLRPVTDRIAGVTVAMPTARVSFDRHEPPFAHYSGGAAGDSATVLLISQRGGKAELYGLFDIMQTLEIVPRTGPRERRDREFTLVGEGRDIVSHTEARLIDGHVKGFTLIWPAGDEARRTRLVEEMIASFEADPDAVMDDRMGEPTEEQSVDLLAGLEIRRPDVVRSGFYVSRRGEVLTSADATADCGRITLNNDIEAEVLATEPDSGLALLEPMQPLAPRSHAAFRPSVPRLKAPTLLAGYSYDGKLGAPSLSYGELADMKGLNGEDDMRRYTLPARPSDAGGPVLDMRGGVLGMLLPDPSGSGRSLPEGVAFAADVDAITGFLDANGIAPREADGGARLARGVLEGRATDMTVVVGCWK